MPRRSITILIAVCATIATNSGALAEAPPKTVDTGLYAAPRENGARRWQIAPERRAALSLSPDSLEGVSTDLPAGTVLTNYGCQDHAGQKWCQVAPLRGGPKGYIRAKDLAPVAGPDGKVARGLDDSARRAKRKRFDETGTIQCAQERGQPLEPCSIGVSRSSGGDVTAAVTFPNGFARLLFFKHGTFISANPTMSGVGRDTDWQIETGLHLIRVDDQRFEIPHALLFAP